MKNTKLYIPLLAIFAVSCNDGADTQFDEDLFEQGEVDYTLENETIPNSSLSLASYDEVAAKIESFGTLRAPSSLDDRTASKCLTLASRLEVKKQRYLKRKALILNGRKVELRTKRNKVTQQRIYRIARKMNRLGCVENVDTSILFKENHIINGGFELRPIPAGKSWTTYSQRMTPGWRIMQASGLEESCSSGAAVEFQNHRTKVLASSSFDGDQFAELDSHCFAQGQQKQDSRVKIFQRVDTLKGKLYKLSFLAASRNNAGKLKVEITNHNSENKLASILELSMDSTEPGLKLKNKSLQRYTHYFVATGDLTQISFEDVDTSVNTYGVLLDDVSLYGVSIDLDDAVYTEGANIKDINRKNILNVKEMENQNSGIAKFLSLGLSGKLQVNFSTPISKSSSGISPTLVINEITYGDDSENSKACGPYLETASIKLELADGSVVDATKVIKNELTTDICGDLEFGLDFLQDEDEIISITIEDTTQKTNADGYDIDYIGFKL